MEHVIIAAPPFVQLERIYLMQATIRIFKGRRDVTAHLFRADADKNELDLLRGMNIIGKADNETPAGATEENALSSVLEAFTAEEGNALLSYLEKRYGHHLTRVVVCPLDIPVPLGMMPFSRIPEGKTMGFIRFDAVDNYNLPFKVRGFYDLEAHEPVVSETDHQ